MSKYTIRHLNENVRQGHIRMKTKAWHLAKIDTDDAIANGWCFEGPVPYDVALKLLGEAPRKVRLWAGEYNNPETPNLGSDLGSLGDPTDIAKAMLPDHYAIMLPNGVVTYVGSDQYTPSSFSETLLANVTEMMDAGAELHTVGKLGKGDFGFASWIPHDEVVSVAGFGNIVPFVNAADSYNGRVSRHWTVCSYAQVCDNTTLGSYGQGKASGRLYELKHTPGAKFDAGEGRRLLEISLKQAQAQAQDIEMAFNIPLTDAQITSFFDAALSVPEQEGRGRTIALNKRTEAMMMLRFDQRVPDSARQTLGGLWQAINTWTTWGQNIKNNADPIGRQHMDLITNKTYQFIKDGKPIGDFWDIVKGLDLVPANTLVNA